MYLNLASILALYSYTRRFGWPMATLLLAPAEGWGALWAPLFIQTKLGGLRPPLPLPDKTLGGVIKSDIRETLGDF